MQTDKELWTEWWFTAYIEKGNQAEASGRYSDQALKIYKEHFPDPIPEVIKPVEVKPVASTSSDGVPSTIDRAPLGSRVRVYLDAAGNVSKTKTDRTIEGVVWAVHKNLKQFVSVGWKNGETFATGATLRVAPRSKSNDWDFMTSQNEIDAYWFGGDRNECVILSPREQYLEAQVKQLEKANSALTAMVGELEAKPAQRPTNETKSVVSYLSLIHI